MNGPNGQACPQCAAPRRGDGTPSCGCTRRAAEALREARTAQAAAAEDFDPLRIRPYVELGDETLRLGAVREEPDATVRLGAVSEEPDLLTRSAAVPEETAAVSEVEERAGAGPSDAEPRPRPRRLRRTALPATGGAVIAVLAAAGYASGLFSYDPPQRDGALPQEIRASVPEASSPDGTSAPAATVSRAAPTPSRMPSPSASPSPSPSSPSPTPSTSPTPSGTPTTAPATATASPTSRAQPHRSPEALRTGDKGPEVRELQLRLRQLALYVGPANGTYDAQVADAVRNYQVSRGITQDEPGVYGAATRAKLESETSEP
ncbi:peptidoglycan-binding protein [Streptomyces sp. NPDC001848]|uniref:peptidoglycan-binding domain-containing protein n=1 Tax=Streptomyces sp. NPDC001848 TaxID=3364618 RepID=UPI0036849997